MKTSLSLSACIVFLFLGGDCKNDERPCVTCPSIPDTTSHNYFWQTFTLGDGNSSALYDVVIINDTLAYAVGGTYLKDSTGQWDFNAYNLAKWNGTKWELKRIPFIGSCSGVDYPPLKSTWAFSANNMLVTNGGSIVTYDGTTATMDCRMNSLLTGAINKIFAFNNQNIVAVGNNGAIVNYYDGVWQELNTGTTANIFDVWGITDPGNGQPTIYVPVSDLANQNGIKKILRVRGNTIDSLEWNTGRNVLSVWTRDGSSFYAVGDGLFVNKGSGWEEIPVRNNVRFSQIRGDRDNNLFIKGFPLTVAHYNGNSWKTYDELSNNGMSFYWAIAVKGNMAILVGEFGNRAGVVVGKRIN